jgi:DNA-binding NtrC family response regulator
MPDQKKTILVVDDSYATLTTIQSILEGSFELSLAKNTDIAKTILKTVKIDLILLDMEMPVLSGMDFLELLQKSPEFYHIPVIIVSSHGTADVIVNAKKIGAVDFAVKPISPEILLDKINTALNDARIKINKVGLVRKLKILQSASAKGQKNQVELIVDDLDRVFYDIEKDPDIAEICRSARKMEYNAVSEKIKPLLLQLA